MSIDAKIGKTIDRALDRLIAENPYAVPAAIDDVKVLAGWFVVEGLEAVGLTALLGSAPMFAAAERVVNAKLCAMFA